MKRCLTPGLVLGVTLFTATSAVADPIVIMTDHRRTSASVRPSSGVTFESDVDQSNDVLTASIIVADGASSAAAAAQLSSSFADPLHWFGAGGSNISWTSTGAASAVARFLVDVQITSPVTYAFAATLFQSQTESPTNFAIADTALYRLLASSFFTVFEAGTGPENQSAVSPSFAGTLFPGDYQLVVSARTSGLGGGIPTASSGYRFTMDFAPADGATVPEPASMLLLGTGLASVVGYRRASAKRRNAA